MIDQSSGEANGGAASADAPLPIIDAPGITPAPDLSAAVADQDSEQRQQAGPALSATARFRSAAAAQIAAARQRLAERKTSPVVAMALVAGLAGAIGAASAGIAVAYMSAPNEQAIAQTHTLDSSITRIETEMAALRGHVERMAKLNVAHAGKTGERLDRIEKAQAEPAAKLVKLTETVEKLRVASAPPPPAPSPSAPPAAAAPSREVTGSINPVPAPVSKPAPTAPPILDGWTLRDVDRDVALIQGRRGLLEVYVGDTIPGVGRVEGFRKQDGRWVVVTTKGLIVSR